MLYPGSVPGAEVAKQLIDGEQALLPVGSTEHGVIPTLHPHRRQQLTADAKPLATAELEEYFFIRRTGQPL